MRQKHHVVALAAAGQPTSPGKIAAHMGMLEVKGQVYGQFSD
jgi:hypothetical protein